MIIFFLSGTKIYHWADKNKAFSKFRVNFCSQVSTYVSENNFSLRNTYIEYFSHLMLLLFMHPFINSNAQSWLRTFPNIAFQLILFLSSLWSVETSVGLSLGRAIRHYMTSTNNLIRMSLSETCENPFICISFLQDKVSCRALFYMNLMLL